ncbi:PP2C family protein-serine/threonine phosphatase [Streptosporangium sp. NPDC051022]|uniref:PP2C family protein-serine/threonine phosphatase n=1 Tax=Streptosporangium sp. NPDC051022 TaxID=3155752 RepID=UPI0034147AB7
MKILDLLERERDRRMAAEREQRRLRGLNAILKGMLRPPSLVPVGCAQVAAFHQTASADQLGGDFYDVFPLGCDRWALFIGDVCGKGAEAAALTLLCRHTLRLAAACGNGPVDVLSLLNAVLLQEPRDGTRMCTALYGVMTAEEDGVRLTLAVAGHPPPLLIHPSGRVEELRLDAGLMLGVDAAPGLTAATIRLDPGQTLLAYTDGLTDEVIEELTEGVIERLCRTGEVHAQAVVDAVRGLTPGPLADDCALLAVTA